MSNRKFYKTIIIIEILSEEPIISCHTTLQEIGENIFMGDWSGMWQIKSSDELNGKDMADCLCEQGSDPEFFQLTEDGDDIDD